MPSKLRIKDQDRVFHSQWTWKKQEVLTITVFALLPIIALAVLLVTDTFSWTVFGAVAALGIIVACYLWFVGYKRKRNSRFTAVLSPNSKLQVEGRVPATGRDFYSKILLDEARSMTIKPLGINATFVIFSRDEEDEDISLLLPYRVALLDELRPIVLEKLKDTQKSDEAQDFYDRLERKEPASNYKREIRRKEAQEEPDWVEASKHI